MSFPDNCIRGIPNDSYLVQDGSVGAHLFHFDIGSARTDGWVDQSINWQDDPEAIEFTMDQRKETGERQFQAGVVVVPRAEIDRLSRQPTVGGILSYERQPLENNRYHGNLLLQEGVPKPTMKKIAACLAVAVSQVIRRRD